LVKTLNLAHQHKELLTFKNLIVRASINFCTDKFDSNIKKQAYVTNCQQLLDNIEKVF